MIVFVDTPVWSLSLRRTRRTSNEELLLNELAELIREAKVAIIGPVRQEILSGILHEPQFNTIRAQLRGFEDVPLETSDFEQAARFSNVCRRHGVQGSQVDFAICAVADRYGGSVFTTDRDFARYAKFVKITLHTPRKR